MKLSKLIEKLQLILKEYGDGSVDTMQEAEIGGMVYQIQSEVQDIAYSKRSGVIVMGKELD